LAAVDCSGDAGEAADDPAYDDDAPAEADGVDEDGVGGVGGDAPGCPGCWLIE
jgi:hypothetical protein